MGKKWTESEMVKLFKMKMNGKSYDVISEKVEHPKSSCATRLHEINCGLYDHLPEIHKIRMIRGFLPQH